MTLQRRRARKSGELIRKYHRISRRGRLAPLQKKVGEDTWCKMHEARSGLREAWLSYILCTRILMYTFAHLKGESYPEVRQLSARIASANAVLDAVWSVKFALIPG